jgi:hypothetical protein
MTASKKIRSILADQCERRVNINIVMDQLLGMPGSCVCAIGRKDWRQRFLVEQQVR